MKAKPIPEARYHVVFTWLNPDQLEILEAINGQRFQGQATVNTLVHFAVKLLCTHPVILDRWFRDAQALDAETVGAGNLKLQIMDSQVARSARRYLAQLKEAS